MAGAGCWGLDGVLLTAEGQRELAGAGDGPSTALDADVALAVGQEQRAVRDRDTPAAPLQPGSLCLDPL